MLYHLKAAEGAAFSQGIEMTAILYFNFFQTVQHNRLINCVCVISSD